MLKLSARVSIDRRLETRHFIVKIQQMRIINRQNDECHH